MTLEENKIFCRISSIAFYYSFDLIDKSNNHKKWDHKQAPDPRHDWDASVPHHKQRVLRFLGGPILESDGFKFENATPFAYVTGHLHPNHAVDSVLVYDLTIYYYLTYLWDRGYNRKQLT
jgi:hypothetical protein